MKKIAAYIACLPGSLLVTSALAPYYPSAPRATPFPVTPNEIAFCFLLAILGAVSLVLVWWLAAEAEK